MKFKIGDVVQIVKVNEPDVIFNEHEEAPETYINQIVTIVDIDSTRKHPYGVEYSKDFNNDATCCYWEETELDFPCKEIQEQYIWNKLKEVVVDIKNLREIPEDSKLKQIFNIIEEYNIVN